MPVTKMAKFKIKIGNKEDFKKDFDIVNYPKLEPGGAPLWVRLGYGVYLELNDIVVLDNVKQVWGWTYCVAFWFFNIILHLLTKNEEFEYNFPDVSFILTFKPTNKKEVLISFDWGEDTSYLPGFEDKRRLLKNVPVPFDECINELYNAANEYIETLLEINPRLLMTDELKELIEARNKAKEAIEKYKQNKQK